MFKTLARDADKAEILRRISLVRPESTARWGRMSANQMICHLADGFRVMLGDRQTALVPAPLPRSIMMRVALYAPVQWPHNIPTTPDLDQVLGGTKPSGFDRDLADLLALFGRIVTDQARAPFDGNLHPVFGPMSTATWLRWAYLHPDHHLRQFGL